MTEAEPSAAPSLAGVAELVRTLANVMDTSGVTELDLSLGSFDVRMRRPMNEGAPLTHFVAPVGGVDAEEVATPGHVITAPMVGTFYAAPTPGSAPFVSAGDAIVAGQTIGIIEAMKIMNEVAADRAGVVLELLVQNGQPVEYGSALLRLDPRIERP